MSKRSAQGERLYGLLLRAWPNEAREELEPELFEVFRWRRDQRIASHGRLGPAFWASMALDAARSGLQERRNPLDARGRPRVGSTGGGDGMRGWMDDLTYAGRRLMRAPGFTMTALIILVLGIGVNSTAFSVVNALLLQPPPFEDAERVVVVLQDGDGGEPNSTSYPAYRDMTQSDVFESVSAFYTNQAFLQQDDQLASVMVEYATGSYLEVTGLAPTRGSWFGIEHDDPSGPPAAVITHRMWMDRLASDPDVLGTTLRINGGAVTVVGVGPEEFNGGTGPAMVDLWLSISAMGATGGRVASLERRQDHPFTVRARVAEGVTLERAQDAMNVLAADLERTYPDLNTDRDITVFSSTAVGQSPETDANLVAPAIFAMAVVMLVLVIGTLNLANLLLVRSTSRAREIAVRLALGAGRNRVIRVVLSEAILLSALGGLGGLGMAALTARILRNTRLDLGLPLLLDLRLDARVLVFTLAMSVVTGVVFGLVPALRATRRDVNASLRDDSGSEVGSRRKFSLTSGLVSAQVAVSLLLLVVSGAFVESLMRAGGSDPGFQHETTAYLQMNVSTLELDDEGVIQFYERLDERLEALPGISRATSSLMLPGAQFGTTTLLLGSGLGGVDRPTETPWNYVALDYFDVMGIPLVHGRLFREDDFEDTSVAVVSESFARTYWGRSDIVGETYRSEGNPDQPLEIIGVVQDVTIRALGEGPTPHLYWLQDFAYPRMNLVAEFDGSSSEAIRSMRSAAMEADSRIMITGAGTMADFLGDTLERQRLAGRLLGVLGGLALLLAMLGIYGVVSFAVSRRQREVGIRIALGAARESVVRLFVRDVAGVVLIGAVIGIALSIPASTAIGQFFTGSGASPMAMTAVAVILVVTSLAATIVPAARAARTDPTNALRQE